MRLSIEIPGQVSLGNGWKHDVVTLTLDTALNILSIGFVEESTNYGGYTNRDKKQFDYQLVPVATATK